MTTILLAFQFLTILPFKVPRLKDGSLGRSAAFFPVVGLALGLLLAGTNALLVSHGIGEIVSSIILVVILIILTGGLHLDGLSDTADALFSGKPKEEMLAIMRDPHVGAMGILGIISALLLKIALLSAVDPELKSKALILMCVLSRWSMPVSLYSFPYARQDGKAKAFIDGMNIRILLIAALTAIIVTYFVAGLIGLLILVVASGCAYFTGLFIKSRIGGVTGDTIGAVSEFTEIITLICFVVLERIVA